MQQIRNTPLVSVVALLCLAGEGAGAQSYGADPPVRTPAFGGSDVFLAPHAAGRVGPVLLRGKMEFGLAPSAARRFEGGFGLVLSEGLQLDATARGGWRSGEDVSGRDASVGLALHDGGRGVSASLRTETAWFRSHAARLGDTEFRAWTGLGSRLDLGVSLRTGTVAKSGGEARERTFTVAGYDFVSRNRPGYAHLSERRDLEVDLTASLGSVRVTGVAGRGLSDEGITRTWAYGRLAVPLPHATELHLEAGRTDGGTDIEPGQRRFARLGLRFDVARRESEDRPVVRPLPPEGLLGAPEVAAAHAEFEDGPPRLLLTAPGAGTVEVKGDFTSWEPRALTKLAGGRWTIPVPRGVARFNIRVDGAEWTVPSGVPTVPDEFSGAPVAVVVVR